METPDNSAALAKHDPNPKTPDEIEAAIFDLYGQGKSAIDAVKALRISPKLAEATLAVFRRLSGQPAGIAQHQNGGGGGPRMDRVMCALCEMSAAAHFGGVGKNPAGFCPRFMPQPPAEDSTT